MTGGYVEWGGGALETITPALIIITGLKFFCFVFFIFFHWVMRFGIADLTPPDV